MDAPIINPSSVARTPLWRRILDFPLVCLVLAIALFVGTTLAAEAATRIIPPLGATLEEIVSSVVTVGLFLLVYKLLIARLGRNPRDDLQVAGALPGFALGVAIGAALFALVAAAAYLAGVYRIVGWGSARDLLIQLTQMSLVAGFTEELLFRGILFRWLEAMLGSWAALVMTSALFGLAHIVNPNATWVASAAIAIEAGLMLGGAYMLARSLWLPIGLHAAWNFTEAFVFDVPVSGIDVDGLVVAQLSGPTLLSGGAFGLEASILAVLLCSLVALAFLAGAVRDGKVVRPFWRRRGSD